MYYICRQRGQLAPRTTLVSSVICLSGIDFSFFSSSSLSSCFIIYFHDILSPFCFAVLFFFPVNHDPSSTLPPFFTCHARFHDPNQVVCLLNFRLVFPPPDRSNNVIIIMIVILLNLLSAGPSVGFYSPPSFCIKLVRQGFSFFFFFCTFTFCRVTKQARS